MASQDSSSQPNTDADDLMSLKRTSDDAVEEAATLPHHSSFSTQPVGNTKRIPNDPQQSRKKKKNETKRSEQPSQLSLQEEEASRLRLQREEASRLRSQQEEASRLRLQQEEARRKRQEEWRQREEEEQKLREEENRQKKELNLRKLYSVYGSSLFRLSCWNKRLTIFFCTQTLP